MGQLCSELAKTGVTIYKLRRFVKAREASNAVNAKVNVEKELDKRLCAGLTSANLKDLFVLAWKHATRKGKVELAHKMCEIAYGIGFNDSAEQEGEPGDSEAAQDGNSQSAGGSNPPQGPGKSLGCRNYSDNLTGQCFARQRRLRFRHFLAWALASTTTLASTVQQDRLPRIMLLHRYLGEVVLSRGRPK